jgi:hypothetical protein
LSVGIAHQYLIRKDEAEKDLCFYDHINKDLKTTEVRKIDYTLAKQIILKYEYLGSMPHRGVCEYFYGIYFNEELGGVLVYGDLTTPLKDFPQFNFIGKVKILHRGVCLHWTPKNTASYMISKSYNLLKEEDSDIKVLSATVDADAGEVGTIYQSLNWYFCATINANDRYRNFVIDGKSVHPRTLYSRHGTSSMQAMRDIYGDRLEVKPYTDKLRYFYFIGSHKENKINYGKIQHKIKPYPRREE